MCRLKLQWWQWCQNIQSIHRDITTYYYTYYNYWAVALARVSAARTSSKLIYKTLPWKRWHVRFAHHIYPLEAAFGSGWKDWDHPVRLSQLLPLGDGCPMFFVNSWALGWSQHLASPKWNEVQCLTFVILHNRVNIIYRYIEHHWLVLRINNYYLFYVTLLRHYHVLLRFLFLHCYYILIKHQYKPIITYSSYYIFVITINTSLLHHCYIIIQMECHGMMRPLLRIMQSGSSHFYIIIAYYYIIFNKGNYFTHSYTFQKCWGGGRVSGLRV